jgi:hypothetical protein
MGRYTKPATPITYGAGYVIKTVESTLGSFTTASSYITSQERGSAKPTMHSTGVAPILLNSFHSRVIPGGANAGGLWLNSAAFSYHDPNHSHFLLENLAKPFCLCLGLIGYCVLRVFHYIV